MIKLSWLLRKLKPALQALEFSEETMSIFRVDNAERYDQDRHTFLGMKKRDHNVKSRLLRYLSSCEVPSLETAPDGGIGLLIETHISTVRKSVPSFDKCQID